MQNIKLVTYLVMLNVACLLPAAKAASVSLFDGKGYPFCVAMATAIRHMPANTGMLDWPNRLPNIPSVSWPKWTPMDPSENYNLLKQYAIKHARQSVLDKRSDDEIWADARSAFDQEIRDGQIKLEQSVISNVNLSDINDNVAPPPWTTDMRIVRIGQPITTQHDIRFRTIKGTGHNFEWAYLATWFSQFPNVTDDLVFDGNGALSLFLVNGKPWFIVFGITIGPLYTSDLSSNSADHRLFIGQECTIDFGVYSKVN